MAVGLTSCTVTPADPSTGKYATQYPQTTLEYSIYINKQITMQPSVGKEDDRLSLITAMQTALDHMKEYKESVESGETDLTNYSHIFETDINVLTGMASLYNQ